MRNYILILVAGLVSHMVAAATLPQQDGLEHTGVASCARSVCHGKTQQQTDENVWLNEYQIWSSKDLHARAYTILRNEESKAIAERLGLANAQTAKICLDCHADFVPKELRGSKFQLSDGVGCEACHGGAEKWLTSHTDPEATHAKNIANGLYPLSNIQARAELCLSCHMGTKDKRASHEIMAAGHPRLLFELDTFSANQPMHYAIDADYHQRKGTKQPIGYLWLLGQIGAARGQLTLLEQHYSENGFSVANIELSIYDCHSCHRPMSPIRGQPQRDFSSVLPVGSLRLQDSAMDMLAVIYQVFLPQMLEEFTVSVQQLQLKHQQADQLTKLITQLRKNIDSLEKFLQTNDADKNQIIRIRKLIAERSSNGYYVDFASAEQAFLSIEALSYQLDDRKKILSLLDAIFNTLANENTFDPNAFALANKKLVNIL